jgi:hypothetical protein
MCSDSDLQRMGLCDAHGSSDTPLGYAWRTELIRDLGGPEAISAQQATLIELAVRQRFLVESLDAWLFVQPSLVNARKQSLLPVLRERQQLADELARYLALLGLERQEKPVDVGEWLAKLSAGNDYAPTGRDVNAPALCLRGTGSCFRRLSRTAESVPRILARVLNSARWRRPLAGRLAE